MKRIYCLCAVLAALLLSAPRTLQAQGSQVRVVHLSPDAPLLDAYITDTIQPDFRALPFAGASATIPIDAGLQRVQIMAAGESSPLIDGDLNIPVDTRVNILVLNRYSLIEAKTISFTRSSPLNADSNFLRIVHATPGAGRVDVAVTDSKGMKRVFSNVAFKNVSIFVGYGKGEVTVEVFRAGTTELVARGSRVLDGNLYGTIVLAGDGSSMKIRLLNEVDTDRQQPMTEFLDGGAQLRFVDAISLSPDVDIYIDSVAPPAIADIGFRDASQRVRLNPGSHSITVVPSGAPISSALFTLDANLPPNESFTVFGVQESSTSVGLIGLPTPLAPSLPFGSILVRFVHALHDTGSVDMTIVDKAGVRYVETDVQFKEYSQYRQMPAGTVDFYVSRAGKPLMQGRGEFLTGSVATILTTGGAFDQNARINYVVESDSAAQLPIGTFRPIVNPFRFVNVDADIDTVSLYQASIPTARVLPFRHASSIVEDSISTSFQLRVSRRREPIGQALLDVTFPIKPDTLRTVFLLAEGTSSIAHVILELTPRDTVPLNHSILRFLNASPELTAIDIRVRASNGEITVLRNIAYKGSTPYIAFPKGATRVTVFAAGDSTTPLIDGEGTLPIGGGFTAIITGKGSALGINMLNDFDGRDQTPIPMLGAPAAAPREAVELVAVVSIVPNPTRDEATISFVGTRSERVTVVLYDASGRGALEQHEQASAGTNRLLIDSGELPAGVYTIVIRRDDGSTIAAGKVSVVR